MSEDLRTQTRKAYLAAIANLFKLLEVRPEDKTGDHRELLMAANDECGRTRRLMIEAWEGEDIGQAR